VRLSPFPRNACSGRRAGWQSSKCACSLVRDFSADRNLNGCRGTFRLQRHRIRVDDCVDESDEGDGIIDVGRNCIFYDERVDSLGDRVVESTLIERVVFPILETRLDVRQGKP